MTPDEHPTLEEWIAATQSCCGVDHDDDGEVKAADEKPDVDATRLPENLFTANRRRQSPGDNLSPV